MSYLVEGPKNDWEDKPVSLGKLFYDALKRGDPDKIIMIQENTNEKITNEFLLNSALSLARYFRQKGLTKSDVIAVLSKNTWKYYPILVAGFLLGIPVTCINPNYTEHEFRKCLGLIDPSLVFCSLNCYQLIDHLKKNSDNKIQEIIVMEDVEEIHDYQTVKEVIGLHKSAKTFEPEQFDPVDTVALIIFSSGTSGHPKAVMLTHQNMRNCISYIGDPNYLTQDPSSVIISLLPMFHLFGLVAVFGCVFYQSMSVLLDGFVPDSYLSTIATYKGTHLYVVPTLMMFLAKSPLLDKYNVSSVTTIVCGAAPVGAEVEKMVKQKFTNVEIKQVYGFTEVAGAVSLTGPKLAKDGSAGILVHGITAKIVDPDTKKILPPGQRGEICVKTVASMKGYLKNSAETEQAFDQDGFLKSGDLGYFDEDGVLFIVDRLKEVIKYKGYQVAPAELEDLLRKYNGVADAAVVGKLDEKVGELPTAYVVKQENANITEEELIKYIAEHVCREKQLHGGVIFVDELPKNPTGKVLRRILREKLNQQ